MANLPVELLDEILNFAVALGTISPNEASHICRRWRTFQKLLFKAVKLDPFDENILDLNEHSHLIPYIKDLRVIPRSGSSSPSNLYDLSPSFTNFLGNLQNPLSMIFCDSRIQWMNVSSKSVDAFLTVFRRDSFRALKVSAHTPFPSWMLLQGLSIASKLTMHYVGCIVSPPESERLLPNFQCSFTHLVLFGNAVQQTAELCLQQHTLAKVLLQKLTHLVLEYAEMHIPPMAPHVENLLIFSGSQLEVLDIRVRSSCDAPPPISESALVHLKTLQHLSIRFTGYSADNDTLSSATDYLQSFLGDLPSCSHLASLSLRVDEQRQIHPRAGNCVSKYQEFLLGICEQLSCTEKWPRLNSGDILIKVHDGNFTRPIVLRETIKMSTTKLEIISFLQVNVSEEGPFRSFAIPQMG